MPSESFVKIKDEYTVHLWNHPEQSRGMIVSADQGRAESISPTLAKILRLMTGERSLEEIERQLAEDYGTSLSISRKMFRS